MPFPQFDIEVPTPNSGGALLNLTTRYVIATPASVAAAAKAQNLPPGLPPSPTRVIPGISAPSIPPDHEVILFIHGHDSRAEECADLVGPLIQTGLQFGKKYAVIGFDLPSNGYSTMIDHTSVAPSNATHFDTDPLSGSAATWPLLDFLDQFVISFVGALDQQVPIKNRTALILGGSLGANLCLRLGERNDQSWIKHIAAWSPGSVWPSFNHGFLDPGLSLNFVQGWMEEDEAIDGVPRRVRFFYRAFDSPTGLSGPTQPLQWYRCDWKCKEGQPICQAAYIADDRQQRQEIYNQYFRRWHWRVALEELLYSHTKPSQGNAGNPAATIQINTLLISGQADDFPHAQIYTNTKFLAKQMMSYEPRVPGDSLFLLDTGHSIHNERPLLLARQIVSFLTSR
jgi:pimeloyl-ACP methyl ester carboxylesterase